MKPRTALALIICLGLSLFATVTPAADFRFSGEPAASTPTASAEVQQVKDRLADIERRLDALASETRSERAQLRVTIEELHESNRLMREQARQQQVVQQPVKADPIPTLANTYLPADQHSAVQAWPASVQWPTTPAQYVTYRNAAWQLPRTMVGNQVVESSPAYEYTDSQGRHWRDYPVSISNQPVAEFEVSNSYPSTVSSCGPGYTCINGQCSVPRTYSMGGCR